MLLISEDLDEMLTLADRIAVMYEGAIVGEVDARSATVEELGLLMAGSAASRPRERRVTSSAPHRAAAQQRRWLMVAVPVGSLVVAFVAIALLLVATGHDPSRPTAACSTPRSPSRTARSRRR